MCRAGSIQQQPSAKGKIRGTFGTECCIHLECANHLELGGNRLTIGCGFVAMQLHRIERHGMGDPQDFRYIYIYEYTDELDPACNGSRNLLRTFEWNATRTAGIEIQPRIKSNIL